MEANRDRLDRKVDAAAWGLFFLWVGIAQLANVGWGVGLLGVGLIVVGAQVSRKYMALKVDRFWLVVGFLFVLGGIWKLLKFGVELVPILCIAAGVAILVSTLAGRRGAAREAGGRT